MLDGLRVVDLSRVLAGPYCTQLLADLGADVVKVEQPGVGDETRTWGPPFAGDESAYFLSVNRGKRGIALDLKDPEARDACAALCAGADVVVENFRPGTLDRLGLGHDALRERNTGLVLCSITGFGTDRDPPDRPGYDFLVQAESGLMAITGPADGEPHKVGVALVDVLAGLNAAVAILAALRERERTGEGRRIEVPLADAALAALVNVAQGALVTGSEPARFGNAHPSIVPYQPFHASDGLVAVAAGNDGLHRRMCDAIGRPDLASDPRFATNPDRVRNRDELIPLLEEVLGERTADEWVSILSEAGVPAGKVRGVLDAMGALREAGADPVVSVDHPAAGRVELVASPVRVDGERLAPTAPPPTLGQHTDAVLREIGVAEGAIAAMRERGAIG